ncbi:MAG: hypothetical protein WBI07_07595 [Mobilitalea sp.]
MKKKYYKMDLHVHTPASKCYIGGREEERYFDILEKAIKEKIDIIAITDHNTIKGYEQMIGLKDELLKEREILNKFAESSDEIKKRIKDITYKLGLFSKLLILPGVEITLNPGIHILVITAPELYEGIDLLLNEVGYSEDSRGSDSDVIPQKDVLYFLECKNLVDKLVIAPHVDSANGIFEKLDGRYRAAIFKASIIKGITCNNIKTLDKIKDMIMNQPDYQRTQPLAYVNASDAHDIDSIGKKVSYACIEKRNFIELYKAFENPTKYISDVDNPRLSEIIDNMLKIEKTILIEELADGDILGIAKAIVACYNSDYNNVIFGVDSKNNIKGIALDKEKIKDMLGEALHLLETGSQQMKISSSVEPLGNGRTVFILFNRTKEKHLWYINSLDEAYIYDSNIKKATISEVISIVEKRMLNDMSIFDTNNSKIIDNAISSLSNLKQPIDKYVIIRETERTGIDLSFITKVIEIKESKNKDFWCNQSFQLGCDDGKIVYAKNEKARLKEAILRYTSPRIKDFLITDLTNLFEVNKQGIIITEQGATYLVDTDKNFIETTDKSIFLEIYEEAEKIFSIYTIVAWLKSSAFIWYCMKVYGEDNIFKPKIYNKCIIPKLKCLKPGSVIERTVIDILDIEKHFLKKVNESYSFCESGESVQNSELTNEFNYFIDDHNDTVLELTRTIDKIIFNEIGYTENQLDIIGSDIENMGIFNTMSKRL